MPATQDDRKPEQRANDLYWGSDLSVNQIADELNLSKSALYGIVEPLPAGLGCPMCGSDVVYPNRTAKQQDHLACPVCTWEGGRDETVEADPSSDVSTPPPPPALVRAFEDERTRTIWGGAFLGAAVGIAMIAWFRRRS